MKKGKDFCLVFGIIGFFFLFIFLIGWNPRVSFSPIDSCDVSGVQGLWDEVYEMSSDDIVVVLSLSGEENCEGDYYAHKVVGDRLYLLGGSIEVDGQTSSSEFVAVSGVFIDEVEDEFTGLLVDDIVDGNQISLMRNLFFTAHVSAESREVSSASEAASEFDSIFAVAFDDFSTEAVFWVFSDGNSSGRVHSHNNSVLFSSESEELISLCEPNWVEVEGECEENDEMEIWYNDTNSCGTDSGRPANETEDCDYLDLGLIGDSFKDSGEGLELYIDGDVVNFTRNYTGSEKVKFINDDDETRVSFSHNFDDGPLNLNGVEIIQQSNSGGYGYMIIIGIDETKTVWIDKKSDESAHVCIKDRKIDSISDISFPCTGSGEYLVSCPGSDGDFECSISGEMFKVEGMAHSGVREVLPSMLGSSSGTTCTPNWDCSGWGACIDGEKSRNCTDLSSCGTTSGKPNEVEICIVGNFSCEPKWDCSDWNPSECDGKGDLYRNCTDANNCGVESGRPAERFVCEEPKSKFPLFIAMGFLVFLIIVAVVILMALIKKRERRNVWKNSPEARGGPSNVVIVKSEQKTNF